MPFPQPNTATIKPGTLSSKAQPPEPPSRARRTPDTDTAIKLYLRELGNVKVLTPPAQIKLAARIRNGDARARARMLKANLRLVAKIARDYEGTGLPLLDLISEGNVGLIEAVERFDPADNDRPSARVSWWIKRSIKRALASCCFEKSQSTSQEPCS